MIQKRQQWASNLLAPHTRLLQFLSSHYNATRKGSLHTEKAFLRLLHVTLHGLNKSTGHPLARELRFQVVLFGLKVLRHSTSVDFSARLRLKDQILSAALSWFSFAPKWSFGGNRLQLKAETQLLTEVLVALKSVVMTSQKSTPLLKSLQAKEDLLHILINSEVARLTVWLFPLKESNRNQESSGPAEASIR